MNLELSSPGNSSLMAPPPSGVPDVSESPNATGDFSHALKMPLNIPPILLEGDDVEAEPTAEDVQKFSAESVAAVEPLDAEDELPEAYGTQKLLLTARDPHWLYAHWDFTSEQQREHCANSADGQLALRVYREAELARPVAEVLVRPEAHHWFVHVEQAGTPYVAELGCRTVSGEWLAITVSAPASTPPAARSSHTATEFATIPLGTPMANLLALAGDNVPENLSLTQALEKLRTLGHPDLPATPPVAAWTEAQARALAEVSGLNETRRIPMGSLEITELIQRQSGELPTSPGGNSSPFGGGQPAKNFWFNVNAELVVYGATEPDAIVTIGGRTIPLRPDGSFSYRFALPDGQYELPVVAVSGDRTDGRAAELKFSRATERRGEVGIHPQDPELKTPAPENL